MTRRRRYRCWRCPSGTDAARRARLGRAWDVSDFLSDFKISLSYTVDRGSRVPVDARDFSRKVKFLSLENRKKLRQLLSAGEGTLFRLVGRDRRPPSPRSACARATRTEGPMFLSEDAFDLDGDDAGCVHLLLFPPLPRHGLGRSRASFHRQRGTLGRGRFYVVPLTRVSGRACPADGRAASPSRCRSTGTASGARLRARGVAAPRPSSRARLHSARPRVIPIHPRKRLSDAAHSRASLLLLFAKRKEKQSRRVAFGESRTRRESRRTVF